MGTSKQPSSGLKFQYLGKHECRYQFEMLSQTVQFSISAVCNTPREPKARGRMNMIKSYKKILANLNQTCETNYHVSKDTQITPV